MPFLLSLGLFVDEFSCLKALLEREISDFLLRTARWTTGWFNKPKFHIILHLVEHIRRFGPAILFATEAFESFNAVIRAKSVHSNRQAPSRDIALAFAQGNRIRHLLSGGFVQRPPTFLSTGPPLSIWETSQSMWRTIGPGPQALMSVSSTATSYLGLNIPTKTIKSSPGTNSMFSRS